MSHLATPPWLASDATPEPVPAREPAAPPANPTGPTSPQRGLVSAPSRPRGQSIVGWAPLWFMGVTGGAGESTLASLDQSWREAGTWWPMPGRPVSDRDAYRVVLVARTNAAGLTAAQHAATEWAAGVVPGVQVVGLALVADAPGRLPRALRDLATVVAGGVPRTWSVPWVEAWRMGEQPPHDELPRNVRAMVADLHDLAS